MLPFASCFDDHPDHTTTITWHLKHNDLQNQVLLDMLVFVMPLYSCTLLPPSELSNKHVKQPQSAQGSAVMLTVQNALYLMRKCTSI